MDSSTIVIVFAILSIVGVGLAIACCICFLCWCCRRLRNDRRRDEELGQSYELKSLAPQSQADTRSKLFVEDNHGNRITKPIVINGCLYGQEIESIRQTTTGFFTDPEVIHHNLIMIEY